MPPLPHHSSWKLLLLHTFAPLERAFRSRPILSSNDLRSIRNFLLLQYDTPLGSAVHATPLYEAIKRHIPDARIYVAASTMAASVLSSSPYVDKCVVTPDPLQNLRGAISAVRELHHTFPSGSVCIATTRGNQRSRIASLAVLTGRGTRIGFTLATPLYDLPLPLHAGRSQIEDNVAILRALGHNVAAPEPQVFFTSADVEYANSLLAATPVSTKLPRIVYVTQNSGTQPNQWRAERFQQVIVSLSASHPAFPIFVGSGREAEAIEALRAPLTEKGISLAGKTSIPQLAALLAQCDAVVSLDTGTFHVARAVQLPGVVIAPAWQDPIEWLPVGHPGYRILRGPSIMEHDAKRFIDEISAAQVIAATEEVLSLFPPSADSRASRMHTALRGSAQIECA